MRITVLSWAFLLVLGWGLCAEEGSNLVVNPGFEEADLQQSGWARLWARDAGVGHAVLDRTVLHSGRASLRVEHSGAQDWSFGQVERLETGPGVVYEISGWVRCDDVRGQVSLSVIPYDAEGKVIAWFWGRLTASGTHEWKHLERRFVVPEGCRSLTFRLAGAGPGTAWFDDLLLRQVGTLNELRKGFDAETSITLETPAVGLAVRPATGWFSLTDLRAERTYDPVESPTGLVGLKMVSDEGSITVSGWRSETGTPVVLRWEMAANAPEVTLTIEGEGEMGPEWAFPAAFATRPGQWLVVPVNEGILYPVDDERSRPLWLVGYSGHGLSMAWFGVTDGGVVSAEADEASPGLMSIVETPDDMRLRIGRMGGDLLVAQPIWQPQKGRWGDARRLRYVLFEDGGYVAQAKRYREYARSLGRLVTLREKARVNPNVDRLVGSVNVWTWQEDKVEAIEELKRSGVEQVLFSNAKSAGEIDLCNQRGYLSSRYDIYQDVYPPGKPPWANHEGWPQDLVLDGRGRRVRGWEIRSKQGNFPGGVVCSIPGLARARKKIPQELREKHYLCRFIDTTTASAFKECYNPAHPTTRRQDKDHKMGLLRFVSQQMKLVTGSETGIDCAVPYVHYFEGMLSLGPYRLPDAGRNMIDVAEPTEDILTFQVGPRYRVPLWELVYHDCVVSTWYWGDYNNKIPAVWDLRDLWNILYGTPPMWMFNEEIWEKNRERFLRCCRSVCPVVRQVGYEEMVSHRFLTADHTVQRTEFSDGTRVTVNFGKRPYEDDDGVVEPGGFRAERP